MKLEITPGRNDGGKNAMGLIQRIEANKGKLCEVNKCELPVLGISTYCDGHAQRAREVGHPVLPEIPYELVHRAEGVIRRWVTSWDQEKQGLLNRVALLLFPKGDHLLVNPARIQSNYTQRQKAQIVLAHCGNKGVDGTDLLIRWGATELACEVMLEEVTSRRRLKYMTTQMGGYAVTRADMNHRGTQWVTQEVEDKTWPHGDPRRYRMIPESRPYTIYWRCPGTVKANIGRTLKDLWRRDICSPSWLTNELPETELWEYLVWSRGKLSVLDKWSEITQ